MKIFRQNTNPIYSMLREGVDLAVDEIRARRMAEELVGKSIGHWQIIEYLGSGKSALVFKGRCYEEEGAVKVFDPELVQRYGKNTQLQRIRRELSVRDKCHEHLVRIIDGGECTATGHLFIVMECVEFPTLESVIKNIPRNKIKDIISQIAGAAKYLESLGLCHRDIKPSNIVISPDYQKAKLLDLGVLRPIGNSDLTDEEAPHFIGTLRYSSPEFLMRKEFDTIEGWRAVTFYQLGAVLHDLIMKKPLFYEYSNPYALLVEAVNKYTPIIEADDVDPDLIQLAKNCLIKNPDVRLQLVNWDSFWLVSQPTRSIEVVKKRVRQRYILTQSDELAYITPLDEREVRRRNRLQRQMLDKIEAIIREECVGNHDFPPMEVKKPAVNNPEFSQLVITFPPSTVHQLSLSLYLVLNMTIMDVDTQAIYLSYFSAVGNGMIDLQQLNEESFCPLFKGVYQEEILKEKIEGLLYLSLDAGQRVGNKRETKLIPIGPFEELRS